MSDLGDLALLSLTRIGTVCLLDVQLHHRDKEATQPLAALSLSSGHTVGRAEGPELVLSSGKAGFCRSLPHGLGAPGVTGAARRLHLKQGRRNGADGSPLGGRILCAVRMGQAFFLPRAKSSLYSLTALSRKASRPPDPRQVPASHLQPIPVQNPRPSPYVKADLALPTKSNDTPQRIPLSRAKPPPALPAPFGVG